MLTKRIIPCLDIKEGRTVKGVNFVELRDAGDPVELAKIYSDEGADGRQATLLKTQAWAQEVCDRGAGEILLTSMDHDGTKAGFSNELLAEISSALSIPVIASGGAGTMGHFRDVFTFGKADAALAASIFHFKEIGIPELKRYLVDEGVSIRK